MIGTRLGPFEILSPLGAGGWARAGGRDEASGGRAGSYLPRDLCEPDRRFDPVRRGGEKAQALEWLEKAYEVRDPNVTNIGLPIFNDRLRSEPRFQELVRCMNLPP
jgi:hypothetical protein